jgi:hypothetical protein
MAEHLLVVEAAVVLVDSLGLELAELVTQTQTDLVKMVEAIQATAVVSVLAIMVH